MVSGRPRPSAAPLAAPAKITATSTAPTRSAMSLTALIEALSPLRYTVGKPEPESTKPLTSQFTWPPASRCPSAGPCTAGTACTVTALVPSTAGRSKLSNGLRPTAGGPSRSAPPGCVHTSGAARRTPRPPFPPRMRHPQRRGERHLPPLIVEIVRMLVMADQHHIDGPQRGGGYRRADRLGQVVVFTGLVERRVPPDPTNA